MKKNFLLDKKEKKILIKWFLESSKNRPKKFSQNFIFHFVILTKNYLFAVRKQKNKKRRTADHSGALPTANQKNILIMKQSIFLKNQSENHWGNSTI